MNEYLVLVKKKKLPSVTYKNEKIESNITSKIKVGPNVHHKLTRVCVQMLVDRYVESSSPTPV
jgi:hypothetical protein